MKVWVRPQDYARVMESNSPREYWLQRPTVGDSVEISVDAAVVETWGKVNNKKLLLG